MCSKKIEDAYPLSPMQQGILFHSVYTPTSTLYLLQESYELYGNLNVAAFEQAWQQVVNRHSILRTAFVWKNLEQPIQVVGRQVTLPLEKQDWRGLSLSQQQKRLQTFLHTDRQQGFQLSKAPLMRLNLIRLSEDTYRFIWSHHHLLLDGWSLSLILQEVLGYYEAFRLGRDFHKERPRPFRDYIAWLQQQDISQAEKFWQHYLQDFTTPTPLVIERHCESLISQEENYAQQRLQLSDATKDALHSLARRHQLTLNTIIQGIWALLLGRYSGEQDVIFGSTCAGRPLTLVGAESMIGIFINTLPMRVQLKPDDFLIPWLKQLQNQQVESLQYDYSPLMEIQGWSQVPRGTPLFESILVSQDYQIDAFSQKQNRHLDIRKVSSSNPLTNYPLTVLVGVRSEFYFSISYNCHRFETASITRMLGHLQTIVEEIVANPEQRLQDLQSLTAAERHQLLNEWNDTQTDYPQKCIHDLFEAQVERSPDAIAVVFADQKLTYRELNARANQLAHYLQRLGVGPEMLVGICLERSLEMVVGLLGILKAGAAYVPLDPAYPQQRLAMMLQDSQISVLLTQAQLREILPPHPAQIVVLDSDWNAISQSSPENPANAVTTQNIAYVIYTSGSTGIPKGVINTHIGLCNRLLWMQETYQLTPSDRVLQKTPFSFDVSGWEFFWPLLVGARLVMAQPGGHQDSAYLVKLIASQQITTVHFVPSMLRIFLEAQGLEACSCLQRVICSGEALPLELQKRFFAHLNTELHNLYGPTEAAIDVTFWACQRQSDLPIVPIGRAIANTQIYILDLQGQPVPIGVSGELHIGGYGLARGYLNRPELTAQKFIPHPFSDQPGERLYRTGDLARSLPDGNFEYIGRIDHQVKVRGFRIEIGEIEAALAQHPAVWETIVLVRDHESSGKHLVAYVVPKGEQRPTNSDLRKFLKQQLPDYMVPAIFLQLEALPLLPNGKINRQALPAPDTTRPELEPRFVAPSTPVETKLAQIWAEVLRVQEVGIHDNFFELGGDSILTLQIISKANQAGLQLTPKQLFQHPNIAELATVCVTDEVITAEQGLVTGSLPLTPIQHWFFQQKLSEPYHFNQAVLLEVQQAITAQLLKQAVQHLLVHHDALRLQFEQIESGWQQFHRTPDTTVPYFWIDLSAFPPDQQASALEAKASELQVSLNLSQESLVQVAFFDLGAEKNGRLLVVIHHLIVDGVSWRILIEDLETAYQQLSRKEAIGLPSKTTSFRKWSQKLQAYANSEVVQQEVDYWLAEPQTQVALLPVDFSEGENTVATARVVSVTLSVAETQALLQEVSAAYRTQINDVLLTALVQAFAQWTGERSLLVNLEGHGREEIFPDVNLSRTVGWFTTLFPVRLHLEAGHPGEALKAVKEQLRSIPNRGVGYGVLRYLSENPRIIESMRSLPHAEVIFNYLGQFDQIFSQSSLFKVAPESSGIGRSLQDNRSELLDINSFVFNGQLRVDWTYSEAIHRRSTIEALAQGFIVALRSLIAHCQSTHTGGYTPSDFPLAKIDQQQLDDLLRQQPQIEDIYPLSPVQQGMLFHTLYAPTSEAYFTQTSCTLHGKLNLLAFQQAWQQVVERHSILRTAFFWEGLDTPLQVVIQQIHLPYKLQDWRGLAPSEQQARWEEFLQADRNQGFHLNSAPLMHLNLIQVANDTYNLIWSHHHLLLDGWSTPLLLKEVFALYQAFCHSQHLHLEPSYPYRNYIAWLQQQNLSQAEIFWRQTLLGFTAPTPLGIDKSSGKVVYDEQEIKLSVAATTALQSFARQHQLTLNTIVQGSWALLLSYYSGNKDVVFGSTISSRPSVLKKAESMVGLFINTLPVRVQLADEKYLLSWLQQLQTQQVEARQYEYSPLAQIKSWSEIPRGLPLFESIVVFENYPSEPSAQNPGLEFHNVRSVIRNHYPLTIRATPGAELSILIMCYHSPFDAATITRITNHFKILLSQFVKQPNIQLNAFKTLLTAADKQQQILKAEELEKVSLQKFKMTKRKTIRH